MESEAAPSDYEAAAKNFKARIARIACSHMEQVDPRTFIVLQNAGVFKKSAAGSKISPHILELLGSAEHPRRVKGPDGPFIFYRESNNGNQQFAVDIASLIFNDDRTTRILALQSIEDIFSRSPLKLSSASMGVIKLNRSHIASEDIERWRPASVLLHDTIESDLQWQLAGVEQCLAQHFDDGLKEYFSKILRPELSSLEKVNLFLITPSEQIKEIESVVFQCSEAQTLHEACDLYFEKLGYLPLADKFSLSEVVRRWIQRHDGPPDVWEVLWGWSRTELSPIARFHICRVFLRHPELGAIGREGIIWREMSEIVSSGTKDDDVLFWRLDWRIRRDLAQHYLRYLEVRMPGARSEPLAVFSWWLAERVASIIGRSEDSLNQLRNVAIIPEAESSEYAWRLSNPQALHSTLSVTTHLGASPWALSVLNLLSSTTLNALRVGETDEVVSTFESGFAAVIMFGFPLHAINREAAVYGFETTLSEPMAVWRTYRQGTSGAELTDSLSDLHTRLLDPKNFPEALRDVGDEDPPNQLIIANWAKSLSIQGLLPKDEVWNCLSDPLWRKKTWLKLVEPAMDELFLSISISLVKSDKKWFAGLSHLYAAACFEAEDKDRKGLLVVLTAISGIHTHSISALQSLLLSDDRRKYSPAFSLLHGSLEKSRNSPPWLVARLRAVLAIGAPH